MHAGRAASGDGQSSPRFTISRSCVIIGTFGLFGTAVFVQKVVPPAQIAPDEAIYLTYFSYSFGQERSVHRGYRIRELPVDCPLFLPSHCPKQSPGGSNEKGLTSDGTRFRCPARGRSKKEWRDHFVRRCSARGSSPQLPPFLSPSDLRS